MSLDEKIDLAVILLAMSTMIGIAISLVLFANGIL